MVIDGTNTFSFILHKLNIMCEFLTLEHQLYYQTLHILTLFTGGKKRCFSSPGFPSGVGSAPSVESESGEPGPSNAGPVEPGLQTPVKNSTENENETISHSENNCAICNITYGSSSDVELESIWLGCAKPRCKYWVHSRCVGIFYHSNNYKVCGKWAKEHFFCPAHYPNIR